MHRPETPHRGGLPVVPRPAPGELLGAWLLRSAEVYGHSLPTLLNRLGIWKDPPGRSRHWYSMNGTNLKFDELSCAVRLSVPELSAMAPATCAPYWPRELGVCSRCLEEAATLDRPCTWQRCWMHPLAAVCETHSTWLDPIATATMRKFRSAADFRGLCTRLEATVCPHTELPAGLEDALWLQRLSVGRGDAQPPWREVPVKTFVGIVEAMAGLLRHGEAESAAADAFVDRDPLQQKTVTLRGPVDPPTSVTLPAGLRRRQRLLGMIGRILRAPGHDPRMAASLIRPLAAWRAADWPIQVLEWVCPQAADFRRRDAELQRELGMTPRYFSASAALWAGLVPSADSPSTQSDHNCRSQLFRSG